MSPSESLQQQLATLAELAESLWSEYQARGPGSFVESAYDEVATEIAHVEAGIRAETNLSTDWVERWRQIAGDLDLLRRAVTRPEGLCFVTGEAGLIPRRDLIQRCQHAVQSIRGLV